MGFASQATRVLKANRVLLKKSRSFKELRKNYVKLAGETQLEFKELSDFEKKRIRNNIIKQAKQDQFKELQVYAISLLLTIVIISLVFWSILQ